MITIPTLTELKTAILADLTTAYGSPIPTFGKSFLRAIAYVQAGRLKLYYMAIASLQKNIFVDTADPESLGGTLERFGRVKLNRDPFPAKSGQYRIQVVGPIGSVIPASMTFKSNDDSLSPGYLFINDNSYVMVSNPDSFVVRALTPGIESKLQPSDGLTSTSPILNVNSMAVVLSEETAPLAAEDIEDYRTKAIEAYRLEPQGGAAGDYRLWALDAQGVKQTYPYAKSGFPAEVNLYVEANAVDSTDGKGTPSPTILAAVEAVVELDPDTTKDINDRGRRPIDEIIHYLPIIPRDIDIKVTGFVGLTAAIQSLIQGAISDSLASVRPFVAGAEVLTNKNDIYSTNAIISTIISVVPGAVFSAVELKVGGLVVSTFTFQNGDLPYFNSISYI
jgi:uncharacterized phage protein gp47/JayE